MGQPPAQRPCCRRRSREIDYVYSENITNTDYERVMREYAEQGIALMVGEALVSSSPPAPSLPTIPKSVS